MCPIPNNFGDRAIWLCSGLASAPSIVLTSSPAAPLSEACESVWSVSWLLLLLMVTLEECCEKCLTSSQMPNMLSPLDFCLWGWMNSEVYRKKVATRDELLINILDVIACIKEHQDSLKRTTRHVLTRVAKCIDVDGGISHKLYQLCHLNEQ